MVDSRIYIFLLIVGSLILFAYGCSKNNIGGEFKTGVELNKWRTQYNLPLIDHNWLLDSVIHKNEGSIESINHYWRYPNTKYIIRKDVYVEKGNDGIDYYEANLIGRFTDQKTHYEYLCISVQDINKVYLDYYKEPTEEFIEKTDSSIAAYYNSGGTGYLCGTAYYSSLGYDSKFLSVKEFDSIGNSWGINMDRLNLPYHFVKN